MDPLGIRSPLIQSRYFTNSHYPVSQIFEAPYVTKLAASSQPSQKDDLGLDSIEMSKDHHRMYLTVDTENVTLLRHLVIHAFHGVVAFMKIEPIDHAKKMKVCLCLLKPVEDQLMSSIMKTLPSAEFGRFSSAL